MTVYKYIVLQDSELTNVKRFKATGFSPPIDRTDDIKITLGGDFDKAAGALVYRWRYVLRVPAESSDSLYGTYDELKWFFELNSPAGTPTDLLTLTDHYGDVHQVIFEGNMLPDPLTTQLDGPNAYMIVPVSFLEKKQSGGSGS